MPAPGARREAIRSAPPDTRLIEDFGGRPGWRSPFLVLWTLTR